MQKWKYGQRLDRLETDLSNSCSTEALILLNEGDIRLQDIYSSMREFSNCRPAWGTHQHPPASPFWVTGKNNNLSFGIVSLPRALTISLVPCTRFPEFFLIIKELFIQKDTSLRIRGRSQRDLMSHNLIPDASSVLQCFDLHNISSPLSDLIQETKRSNF